MTLPEAGGSSSENGLQRGGSVATLPLAGRVAIVTGSSGGIGQEIALHLATLGAKVVLADIRPAAESNVHEAQAQQFSWIRTDVSKAGDVKAMFDHAEQTFGPDIHILVHCVGICDTTYPTVADTTEDSWDRTYAVNAKGTFLCCREAANRLVRGGGGRIITIGSSTVAAARPLYGAYTSSKAAVETMVRIMAKELKGTRITANSVAPGPIATPLFYAGKSEEEVQKYIDESPLCRLGTPRDVAPTVGHLAGDAGEWINGQIVRVNGGYV
ncbi:NADPH-dependent aldehyde reductase-like protein, chloroplastic [Aristolochia californica]|uniref:NADPH-dependent aldehyde reductase-like protein, chloroplastic n=1 Tax=Aristolochia californica TaxID=171875 RepID=UPI0035DD80B4